MAREILGRLLDKAGRWVTPRSCLAGLMAVAAVVRLIHLATSFDDPYLQFRFGDETYYHQWALEIAGGSPSKGEAFFTAPLFPYFLAVLYGLGLRTITAVGAVNAILGLGAVYLTYVAARRVLSPWHGVAAAALVGLCAAPVFHETFASKAALVLLLTAASVALIVGSGARERARSWLVSGICVGVTALGHPLMLVLAPCAWLYLLSLRRPRREALKAAALLAVGVSVGVLPATMHNIIAGDELVLISANGGMNFYIGNHKDNRAGKFASPWFAAANVSEQQRDFKREAQRRTGAPMTASEVSRYWWAQGIAEIEAQPWLSLRRCWRKLRWALGAEELTESRAYDFYRPRLPVLRMLPWGFGVVSLLGLVGIALGLTDRKLAFFASLVALLSAGMALFFVFGRLRLPLIVPLSITGAYGLSRLVDQLRRRDWKVVVGALSALPLGWFVFGEVLPGATSDRYVDYYNQGTNYLRHGRYDLAIEELNKAMLARRGVPEVHFNLGQAYAELGRTNEAVGQFRASARLRPRHARTRVALAVALIKTGAVDAGLGQLQAALRLEPTSPVVQLNLGIAQRLRGSCELAIGHFKAALKQDPRLAPSHAGLGRCYRSMGRYGEAIAHYRSAVRLEPDNGSFKYNLGNALIQAGRLKEAIEQHQAAASLRPDDPDIQHNLGVAYKRLGLNALAERHLRRAAALQRRKRR